MTRSQTSATNPLTADALTANEAALFLDQRYQTMASWRRAGTGPKYRKIGGAVLYLHHDLRDWLVDENGWDERDVPSMATLRSTILAKK